MCVCGDKEVIGLIPGSSLAHVESPLQKRIYIVEVMFLFLLGLVSPVRSRKLCGLLVLHPYVSLMKI